LERNLAKLLELSGYHGTLRFTVTGGTWTSAEGASFADFLDAIEAGLRVGSDGELVTA
jgi:hypothetical protein